MRLTHRTLSQIHSPIGAANALRELRGAQLPLLDLSQAAPSFPTAPAIAEHVAAVAHEPDGGRYCPQEGLPDLRQAFATELSSDYRGTVRPDQVLITAGCNQAFCVISSAIAAPNDEIILPVPFYFNHDMWMKLDGLVPVYLNPTSGLEPKLAEAEALVSERTRAVVLVTPGNPTGAIFSPATIEDFADFAARHDLLLIIDETYRSYRRTDEPAHGLFARSDWDDHVVSLHSFSKDMAIPGYRIGAAVGRPDLLAEAMKLLDCVAICAPRIGQEAALAGLTKASDWRAEQAARIGAAQITFEAIMSSSPGGFDLVSSGAYFGWVRHPFADESTDSVVRRLLLDHDILTIPGTAFTPSDERFLRLSFANLDHDQLYELATRLENCTS
ncbi:MAG: aminotransferase [Acidimicrobiales bacterium]